MGLGSGGKLTIWDISWVYLYSLGKAITSNVPSPRTRVKIIGVADVAQWRCCRGVGLTEETAAQDRLPTVALPEFGHLFACYSQCLRPRNPDTTVYFRKHANLQPPSSPHQSGLRPLARQLRQSSETVPGRRRAEAPSCSSCRLCQGGSPTSMDSAHRPDERQIGAKRRDQMYMENAW